MAKKLSDINLQGDRRKAEKMYERALGGGEGSSEASRQLEKPRFKSFLQDIIDKKNVGKGGALVKDPQPDILKEELIKTADKLQEILRLKRSNSRLHSKLEESRRIRPPGDTPTKKGLGLGAIAGAVAAPAVNLLGALKDLIGIAILNWISDPKNFEMVKGVIKTLQALVKFFSAWIGGSISNFFEGWHELTRGGSLAERLGGFFKLMVGFTGLKWLMRPGTIFKDLKLIFKNLKVWPKTLKGLFGKNARQFEQKTIDKFLKNRFGRVFGRGLGRAFGRVFLRIFGTGNTDFHVNIRSSKTGEGDKPVAVQAVTDYGDFYAGGGARSVANEELFSKDKVPSREVDGIKVNRGWSEIYEGVISKYTDKPMILSVANKGLIPMWRGLGFAPYVEEKANLPESVKKKLKSVKYPIYYRDGGEMKKSFAYVWAKYVYKCDL